MRLPWVIALIAALIFAVFLAQSSERAAEHEPEPIVATLQPQLDSVSRLQASARLDSTVRIALPGTSEFDVSLQFPNGRPRFDWQGLEIELVWQEVVRRKQPARRVR